MSESESDESNLEYGTVGFSLCPEPRDGEFLCEGERDVEEEGGWTKGLLRAPPPATTSDAAPDLGELVAAAAGVVLLVPPCTSGDGVVCVAAEPPPPDPVLLCVLSREEEEEGGRWWRLLISSSTAGVRDPPGVIGGSRGSSDFWNPSIEPGSPSVWLDRSRLVGTHFFLSREGVWLFSGSSRSVGGRCRASRG